MYTAVYIELLRCKITFRREISFRSTLGDRTLHTSSYMSLRTGRSGGHSFTYRHVDLYSYLNKYAEMFLNPKLPNPRNYVVILQILLLLYKTNFSQVHI